MSKAGRNDPCPCGSGLKYKRCCLTKDRKAEGAQQAGLIAGGRSLQWVRQGRLMSHEQLSRELRLEIDAVEQRLRNAGVPPGREDDEEGYQAFMEACRARWATEPAPGPLRSAGDRLLEMDSVDQWDTRGTSLQEGPEVSQEVLTEPAFFLMEAGEAGVPVLASVLHTETWASMQAVEALVSMPAGPLRDRALMEALFSGSDGLMDTAVQEARSWSEDQAMKALTAVARHAAEQGIELQCFFWSAPFEWFDEEDRLHLQPRLVDAALLLYRLGHFDALDEALEQFVNPAVSGVESVRHVLTDGVFRSVIDAIHSAKGQTVSDAV
jgi:hypothetical protein